MVSVDILLFIHVSTLILFCFVDVNTARNNGVDGPGVHETVLPQLYEIAELVPSVLCRVNSQRGDFNRLPESRAWFLVAALS